MTFETVRYELFFLVNRVDYQKRNQTAREWSPFGFVFGVQLDLLEKKTTRRGLVRATLVHMKILKLIFIPPELAWFKQSLTTYKY